MKIQITAGGIYNAKGEEIPVGTELTVKGEPTAWAGRYTVVSGGKSEGKTAVTNPAPSLKAEHHGGGKFNITEGEKVLKEGLTKADADAFNALSDEDKAAFIAAQSKD
ncbi:MAG TPA: hypothetical protein VEA44_10695 [Caulobacter sp.]|nr:hypothetical protein [Caulobacter sp.]